MKITADDPAFGAQAGGSTGVIAGGEADEAVQDHVDDTEDAHDASSVSIINGQPGVRHWPMLGLSSGSATGNAPFGGSTNVQEALEYLAGLIAADTAASSTPHFWPMLALTSHTAGEGEGDLGWFVVTDAAYGATGNGVTDDTASINSAIVALNSAGGGTLYFPRGSYLCSSALTTISVPCVVRGDGGGSGPYGAGTGTKVLQSSATANLFVFSDDGWAMEHIALDNTNAGTPSAGAGISSATAYFARLYDVTVSGFYDNISLSDGAGWSITDCFIHDPVRYGLRIQGTVSPDSGDQSISGTYFMADTRNGDAAIRYESAGGLKLANVKINDRGVGQKFVYGIDLAVPTGVQSGVLHITGCSIENVSGDAIRGTTSGTGTWAQITIVGLEVGLYGNNTGRALNLVGAGTNDFFDIVIDGYNFRTDGTVRAAITVTNVDNILIGSGVLNGFNAVFTATTSTDVHDHTGGIAAGVEITGTPSAGQVPTATGATAATWQTPSTMGPLLLASDKATPIVFDDILQASDGADFLYASEP